MSATHNKTDFTCIGKKTVEGKSQRDTEVKETNNSGAVHDNDTANPNENANVSSNKQTNRKFQEIADIRCNDEEPNGQPKWTKHVAIHCEYLKENEEMITRILVVDEFGHCIYDKYRLRVLRNDDVPSNGVRDDEKLINDNFQVIREEVSNLIKNRNRFVVCHTVKNSLGLLLLQHSESHLRDISTWRLNNFGERPSLEELAFSILGIAVNLNVCDSVVVARILMNLFLSQRRRWEHFRAKQYLVNQYIRSTDYCIRGKNYSSSSKKQNEKKPQGDAIIKQSNTICHAKLKEMPKKQIKVKSENKGNFKGVAGGKKELSRPSETPTKDVSPNKLTDENWQRGFSIIPSNINIFENDEEKKKTNEITSHLALDCECVRIVGEYGQEINMVARVTLVNMFGDCIYDKFVKPDGTVTNYRTSISGIRKKDLLHGINFRIIQNEVADLLKGRILVGHSVEYNLQYLRLNHPKTDIRDMVLGTTIQDGKHDSRVGAKSAMTLYLKCQKEWEAYLEKKPHGDAIIKQTNNICHAKLKEMPKKQIKVKSENKGNFKGVAGGEKELSRSSETPTKDVSPNKLTDENWQRGFSIIPSNINIFENDEEKKKTNEITSHLALDCECVGIVGRYSGEINMVARVTLVNMFGNCIYDKFVKPHGRVTNYRTSISGIREKDLLHGIDFRIVKNEVADLLKGRILVGHSVEYDLQYLHLNHPKTDIRDTAEYPPFRVYVNKHGQRPSLKRLAELVLDTTIQDGEHDSRVDAKSAMRLYLKCQTEWEAYVKNLHETAKMSAIAINCKTVFIDSVGKTRMTARVSLVDFNGKCIYDTFIKPHQENNEDTIVDYRGFQQIDLENGEDHETVQKKLHDLTFGRILIGHSVSYDTHALCLPHKKVDWRDTADYKPFRKLAGKKNQRPSLKKLADKILQVSIQDADPNTVVCAGVIMQLYRAHFLDWENELILRNSGPKQCQRRIKVKNQQNLALNNKLQ